MNEIIEIKTINDIYQLVTKDNLDRFMLDFYKTFHTIAEAKEGNPEAFKESKMTVFIWKDDSKNEITLTLNPIGEGESKEIKF